MSTYISTVKFNQLDCFARQLNLDDIEQTLKNKLNFI